MSNVMFSILLPQLLEMEESKYGLPDWTGFSVCLWFPPFLRGLSFWYWLLDWLVLFI